MWIHTIVFLVRFNELPVCSNVFGSRRKGEVGEQPWGSSAGLHAGLLVFAQGS